MKQQKHVRQAAFCITFITLMTMVGQQVLAAQQRKVQQETQGPAASSTLQSNGSCGPEMEFDRNSGRMIRKSRVDLMVTQVELKRLAGNKVAIKPTIKNRCPGGIDRNVSVLIDDVVISFGPPPPNTPVTTTALVLDTKTSYRVTVDNNNQVKEINEHNNVCTARFPSTLPAKIHRCP